MSPILKNVKDALQEIFPQGRDTPEERLHAEGINIHFVASDAALRAALQGEEPAPAFGKMREQLFRIIRRCESPCESRVAKCFSSCVLLCAGINRAFGWRSRYGTCRIRPRR